MNEADLLSMLDIAPEEVSITSAPSAVIDTDGPPTVSPFALQLDEWDVDQGRRCLIESRHFEGINADEAADFHALYFHQVPRMDRNNVCSDPRRSDFIELVMDTPDYHALHEQTRGNPYESMMAAGKLAQAFAQDRPNEDNPQDPEGDSDATGDGQGDHNGIGMLLAVAEAVKEAQEEADAFNAVKSALGFGSGEGDNGNTSTADVQRFFETVKNNPQLRRIMELAGKYRRVAQSQQRAKKSHGLDDVVGVEQDNDISRLLPIELARLADEDLELDMLRRFAESQTVCRKHEAPEPEGRGPVVVVVDESGSMRGEKIAQAKAFALAMAWVARHQKRFCCLVSFADSPNGRVCVLPPGGWNQDALLSWLSGFIGGGTSLDCPLASVPFQYYGEVGAPKGKTDMILLTDGIVHLPRTLRDRFNDWKSAESVTLSTLIIGTMDRGEMGSVSDEIHNVADMGLKNEAVRSAMAI